MILPLRPLSDMRVMKYNKSNLEDIMEVWKCVVNKFLSHSFRLFQFLYLQAVIFFNHLYWYSHMYDSLVADILSVKHFIADNSFTRCRQQEIFGGDIRAIDGSLAKQCLNSCSGTVYNRSFRVKKLIRSVFRIILLSPNTILLICVYLRLCLMFC